MDEKGFLIGVINESKRVVPISMLKQGKITGTGQDGNRSWITFIASICCDGTFLPPALIYQGAGNLQTGWVEDFDGTSHKCFFTSTPTGWTNEDVALYWLQRVFDQSTRPKARSGRDWRLLWLDGHNSHINMRFLNWCHDNRILVAQYPPHSTHRLQPLDVSCFGALSTRYSQQLDQWLRKHGGIIPLNQNHFYSLFWPALHEAFSEHNILSGWRKTGLYPFNPQVVLQQIENPPSRPSSSDSKNSSILSASDWRRLRRVVKQEVNPLNQRLLKGFERVAAQNQLLQAEIQGLKETVQLQKKTSKRNKNLFEQLQDSDGNKAIFYSPTKIEQAKRLVQQKEEDERAQQAEKEQRALQRQLVKEAKEKEAELRRQRREEVRVERAKQAALKQAEKEAKLAQRTTSRQFQNKLKTASRDSKKAMRQLAASRAKKRSIPAIVEENPVEGGISLPTRSGRQPRKPKHLKGFQL